MVKSPTIKGDKGFTAIDFSLSEFNPDVMNGAYGGDYSEAKTLFNMTPDDVRIYKNNPKNRSLYKKESRKEATSGALSLRYSTTILSMRIL